MQELSSLILPIVLFLCFIALLKFALIAFAKNLKNTALSSLTQYQKRKELFSPAERSFLGVLEQALDNNYRIFGKVRLGDVIQPKRGISNSAYFTSLNKVNKKHVDFVVCRKDDCQILGVVELDDKTHNKEDRKKRDKFVDDALNEAGVPILHFSAKMSYPVKEVRASLINAFSLRMGSEAQNEREEFQVEELPEKVVTPEEGWKLGGEVDANIEIKNAHAELCPDCGNAMRAKKVSKGPHQGKFFFVCADYPKCKTVKRVIDQVA